jgi:hypothetical protein
MEEAGTSVRRRFLTAFGQVMPRITYLVAPDPKHNGASENYFPVEDGLNLREARERVF